MNKKLFETRMNSVKHYQNEITNLGLAKKVTESTLRDLVDSFIEFNPFKKGDVILIKDRIAKVVQASGIYYSEPKIELCLIVNFPDSYGGYRSSPEKIYIKFNDLENIKTIFSEPELQNQLP